MSEHAYNSSPEHIAFCADCWNAKQKVAHVFTQLAREKARHRLQLAADSIAADPRIWLDFESDIADSDCLRIAALLD